MFRRYAFVRQDDQSDCGAAALATVARHHRMPVSVQQLRELTGTDRIGTNLRGMVRAAEKLGLTAKGVKATYDALPEAALPAIAHVSTDEGRGHFVVVHRVTKKAVTVADPGRGIEKRSRDEFSRSWTGYLLLIQPVQNVRTAGGTGSVSPWRRLLGLIGFHRRILVEAFCCALLMAVLGTATSFFIQHLVDSVLVRHERQLLNVLGVGLALIIVFRTLFGLLRHYLLVHVGRNVDLTLISGYASHVLGLPLRFFEMRRVGEILSRVHDAAKVREAIGGMALTVMVDGTLVVALLAVLWFYDWPLAFVSTASVPLLIAATMLHHPLARRRSRTVMEDGARLAAHLVEDVSGVETFKAFGAERKRTEEGQEHLVKLTDSVFSLEKLGVWSQAGAMFLTAVAGLVVLWYGGHRVMDGKLSIGQLMLFYSLLGYLLAPLQGLAGVNLMLQDALIAVDRLYQIMDLKLERSSQEKKIEFRALREAIELRDVSFAYGYRGNVLEKLSLRITAGQTVAIVGESGSGKSTLLKLLMGFYDPTEGSVLIDGINLNDFELASLRGRIGLVSQDPFVFNGTIRENIALGRPGAGLEEVIEAARAAGLDEFIAGLPRRYETMMGERGANLSGGQRQRLAIARALLRQPELLIFDEATSHLDTSTERAIKESLRTAFAGRTVILVAHRLSTISHADQICLMHQGRVIEQGTHRELLERGERYAVLWLSQTDDGSSAERDSGRRSRGLTKAMAVA